MKKVITLTACLFLSGLSFAQKSATTHDDPATAQRKLVASGKCAINGTIRDEHNHPLSDVRLFIYGKDSSILASGFTDEAGAYETNSVLKGIYNVKIVYPAAKTILVLGVTMKPGYTPLNVKAEAPAADTTVPYAIFAPKPVEKGKHGAKAGTANTTTTTTTTTKVTTTTTKAATTTAAPAPAKK